MAALTIEEAHDFLLSAVSILVTLEDLERPDRSAILKEVMNCGEATILLGALVALIADNYPSLVDGVDYPVDLASRNFRREH